MAYQKDINTWYQQFAFVMQEQGIDLNNKNDLQRLRVPGPNQQGSVPLFSEGFTPSPANMEKLHQAAEQGNLFFFQKRSNEPLQLTANADNSVSTYNVREVQGRPPAQEVPMWYTALNVVTLGITDAIFGRRKEYKEQMKAFKAHNVEEQSFWKRAVNRLSRGYFFGKNFIEQNQMETKQAVSRGRLVDTLFQEKAAWDKRDVAQRKVEAQKRKAQRQRQKQERMKAMIKEAVSAQNQPKQMGPQSQQATPQPQQNAPQQTAPQSQNHQGQQGGDYESPAAKANMFKTQMAENYELIKDAFGPNGDGWGTILKAANNIDHIAKELKQSPELMEKAVMSEKKCQRAENLCTSLRNIAKDGMEAKGKLMAYESSNLSKEDREKYIRDAVKMDLVQNTLQNSAYAKANTNQAEAISKTSRLINNMRKDPEQSSQDMDRIVDSLGIVDKLMDMNPEDLAIYLQSPDKMCKDIQSSMKEKAVQVREENQKVKELQQSKIQEKTNEKINEKTQEIECTT